MSGHIGYRVSALVCVCDAGDRYKDMVMGQGATLKQGDRIDIRYTHDIHLPLLNTRVFTARAPASLGVCGKNHRSTFVQPIPHAASSLPL